MGLDLTLSFFLLLPSPLFFSPPTMVLSLFLGFLLRGTRSRGAGEKTSPLRERGLSDLLEPTRARAGCDEKAAREKQGAGPLDLVALKKKLLK